MLLQLAKIFGLTGLATIFLVLWAVTILYTFIDSSRRGLPSGEQSIWMAVVTLLPLVGFLAYRIGRRLAWRGVSRWREAPAKIGPTDTQSMPTPSGWHAAPPPAGLPASLPASPLPRPFPAPNSPGSTQPVASAGLDEETGPVRSQAPYKRLWLAAVEGPHTGQLFQLQTFPAQIGRGTGLPVRLDNDTGVSRQHAEIYWQDGGLRVRDLNSTHGTYVNGYSIQDISLQPSDTLRVGSSVLSLRGER